MIGVFVCGNCCHGSRMDYIINVYLVNEDLGYSKHCYVMELISRFMSHSFIYLNMLLGIKGWRRIAHEFMIGNLFYGHKVP